MVILVGGALVLLIDRYLDPVVVKNAAKTCHLPTVGSTQGSK